MKISKTHIRRSGLNRHPKAKLLALGGLLFSLGMVTSVAATYAWYTINVMTSVGNLNVRITSEPYKDFALRIELENKEIREKGGPRLTPEDRPDGYTLADMDYDSEIGLNDVSGMYQSEWFQEGSYSDMTFPQFRSHYFAMPSSDNPKPGIADKGFLQTVLYLSATEDCEIYLSIPMEKLDDNVEVETSVIKATSEDEKLKKVANTIRLSFYSEDGYEIAYQPVNENERKTTYYGGPLDMNGDGYYDYFEGKEVFYGEYDNPDKINYSPSDGAENALEENLRDVFTANHYDVERISYGDGYSRSNPNPDIGVRAEESHSIYEYIYDANKPLRPLRPICKLKANTPKRVVFSVYCEGWDLDMTDAINQASFNINVGFTALINEFDN